jgi:hypothetical protein
MQCIRFEKTTHLLEYNIDYIKVFFQNFQINFLCLKKQSLSWATCNPGYTWVSGPYLLYSLMSINRLMLDVVLITVRCYNISWYCFKKKKSW